jgi:hypothetical protein
MQLYNSKLYNKTPRKIIPRESCNKCVSFEFLQNISTKITQMIDEYRNEIAFLSRIHQEVIFRGTCEG